MFLIFKSDTYPNAYIVLTELLDKQGHEVVAAVHLSKTENRILVNRIASVHSRTNDYGENKTVSFVETQAEKGNLKYIDDKKSRLWTTSRGLQLPKLVQSLTDNNNILHKEDIVNSSLFKSNKNDTYSLQNARTINGYYNKKTKTIHINLHSNMSPLSIFGHELFHSLPKEQQRKLVAFFMQNANTNTEEFKAYKAARMEAYQRLYDKEGLGEFTERDFWNEFAAENCETLFTNQDYINKLAQLSNKSKGLKKVLHNILDFIRKVWRMLTGTTYKNSRATEVAGLTAKQLAEAEAVFAKALGVESKQLNKMYEKYGLNESAQDRITQELQTVAAASFSIVPEFYQEFDAWNKKDRGIDFLMGYPSKALISAGIPDKPLVVNSGRILDKAKQHGYEVDYFRKLPELLENPMLVLKSKSDNNSKDSFVVYGELYDESNRPMMVSLKIHSYSKDLHIVDVNRVTSMYARQKDGSANADQYLIDNSEILYPKEYNKRTADWSKTQGLQLPKTLQGGSSDASISYSDNGVNTNIRDEGKNYSAVVKHMLHQP
ncbi:MAG: hypothetical protein BWY15_00332 [Firmicutes bacterium ADurb.Bin193]|nr:MAG: hypothetical protein BWY15_00332 [Firmicutes bacterium ADurb.Bin193]